LKHQIIGQKILGVKYFELNEPHQPFYFEDFDNFDLGIEIELSNGFSFHIGWKEYDKHEIGEGKYIAIERLCPRKQVDATKRWSSYLNLVIQDIEIFYVNKEWKVPAQCTISFENNESISIILASELNLDGSLPIPLKYENMVEIYVFHSSEPPPTELVELIFPDYPQYIEDTKEPEDIDFIETQKSNQPSLIGVLILFIIALLVVIKLALVK
jgi:hypothetical protein